MKRSIGHMCMLLIFLFLSGCKKEDPNPELLDPIYSDLLKRATDAQKSLDEELKKQIDNKIALDKAEVNTIELKSARREVEKSERIILESRQRARYYKIRSDRRLLVDRLTYKKAFAKGETWPDPREYSEYLVNIRLNEAPRNWTVRVPKLQDRLVSAHQKSTKGEEKSTKAEE